MDLLSMLLGSMTSDESLQSLEKKTGVGGKDLTNLLGSSVPMLLESMTGNASSQEGAQSLLNALSQHQDTGTVSQQLDNVDEEDGQKIINHILGDNSDKAVQQLSQKSGLSMGQVAKVLACLAPILMSGLSAATNSASHQQSSGVNLADGLDLSDIMGLMGGGSQSSSGMMGMLGSLLGGSKPQSSSNGMQLLGSLLSLMK